MRKLLEMKNITKQFPGVLALDGVDFSLKEGSVHALMGENGAGKSTLMKCLFGMYQKDGGEIYLRGEKVDFPNAKEALRNGVAMVQQELNQAIKRSVMDNVWLGRYPKKWAIMVDHQKMYQDTLRIFADLDIRVDPKEIMSNLSVSERQMVEIAKVVSYGAKVIVFDEPTSSLTDVEIKHLFEIIKKLKKQKCGIIYISHKMDEITEICDYITIMRDGHHISTNPIKKIQMNEIIKQMVGRELKFRFPQKDNKPQEVILKVEGLTSKYDQHVNQISFELRRGEILGIAGLIGAGRTELISLIFGVLTKAGGLVEVEDKVVKIRKPRHAIHHGFSLLTEERRETGIFNVLNVLENATAANIKDYTKFGILSFDKMRQDTNWVINAMNVKTPSYKTRISNLSGGNQQKVLLGRALLTNPLILLLDEPTRGVDVGAKYEIYELMIKITKEGKSIIMVSSELPELLGICDRIMVVSNGLVAGFVDPKETTQEEIMELSWKFI